MLSADPRPTEAPLPRHRRPSVATRQLLFAMATPPIGRSEALWPTWLVPVASTWRRRPARSRSPDSRSD